MRSSPLLLPNKTPESSLQGIHKRRKIGIALLTSSPTIHHDSLRLGFHFGLLGVFQNLEQDFDKEEEVLPLLNHWASVGLLCVRQYFCYWKGSFSSSRYPTPAEAAARELSLDNERSCGD
jgi:hypothetical protein